jgi:predicted HTH transcriptional regulator
VFRTIIPLTASSKPTNPLEASLDVPVNSPDVPVNVPVNSPDVPANDTVALIISLMADEPRISLDAIAEKIGRTRKTVQRAIKKLKDSGRVKRVGPDKTGHWEVTGTIGDSEGIAKGKDTPQ